MYLGIAGSYDCCFGTSLYELALTFQRLTSNCQQTLGPQLDKAAREQLSKYGDEYGVAKTSQIVAIGRPESEIHRLAKEHDVDLIIVGSHGRKGLQLLLGSTANGVLHGTECDVLAVRIN